MDDKPQRNPWRRKKRHELFPQLALMLASDLLHGAYQDLVQPESWSFLDYGLHGSVLPLHSDSHMRLHQLLHQHLHQLLQKFLDQLRPLLADVRHLAECTISVLQIVDFQHFARSRCHAPCPRLSIADGLGSMLLALASPCPCLSLAPRDPIAVRMILLFRLLACRCPFSLPFRLLLVFRLLLAFRLPIDWLLGLRPLAEIGSCLHRCPCLSIAS